MRRYSPSALSSFETCPKQFSFKYIEKPPIEKKTSIEAFLGSCVHKALQHLYENINMCRVLTLNELVDVYEEEWKREWKEEIVIRNKNFSAENFKNIGKECLRKYYNRHHPFNRGTVVFLEKDLSGYLDDEKKYKVGGYPDRIIKTGKDSYEIHDYKTSKNPGTYETQKKDKQLVMYQIILPYYFQDVKNVELVWHFLRSDIEVRICHSIEDISKIKLELIKLIQEIESETKFEPKENGLCNWCDYLELCPAKSIQ